jgi:deoxyadenosine/deoxycytidine kinase
MVRLTAWQRRLRLEPRQSGDIVLLDHGPIFKLVRLREFGPEFVNSIAYQKWWERILQQWCDTLDVVIWLDAPDDVLLERIQTRSTEHRMKEKAPVEAFEFLSHYRTCYQRIVDNCVSKGNPLVLRCDTERDTLDQTVTRILAMLDQIRTGMEVKTHVA